jgi:RNA polymerase sigma factor (sigma-70 family)
VTCSAGPSSNETDLIRAIQRGDAGSAARLYHRVRPSIERALRRTLRGGSDDFEDLVQVTFERLLRTVVERKFQGRSQLGTWASSIAVHVAIDAIRRRIREQRVFAEAASESSFVSDAFCERRLEARCEVRRILAVLSRMKPQLARMVVAHDVLGHDVKSVAALEGLNANTAQSRLRRARLELLRRVQASVASPGDFDGAG